MPMPDLLSAISVLLAIIAILLALGGIYAFVNLRDIARKTAVKEAQAIAAELAEKAAVSYLEQEIPAIIAEYMELGRNAAEDAKADEVAANQEDGGD